MDKITEQEQENICDKCATKIIDLIIRSGKAEFKNGYMTAQSEIISMINKNMWETMQNEKV